jgi:hypothetical protein
MIQYTQINKLNIAYQQFEQQKVYDNFNRCSKNIQENSTSLSGKNPKKLGIE